MNVRRELQGAVTGLVLIAGTVGGCPKSTDNNLPNLKNEYNPSAETIKTKVAEQPETITTLEGKILKVQSSFICFGDDTSSVSHEFLYVTCQTSDNKLHTLIYPSSKAIFERTAKISYRPLRLGAINAQEFIKTFIEGSHDTKDNIVIEAEGVITNGGISYNTP